MYEYKDDLEKEVFEYLDNLREIGSTNMWGATMYIQDDFDFDEEDAKNYLLKWMKTFEERHIE